MLSLASTSSAATLHARSSFLYSLRLRQASQATTGPKIVKLTVQSVGLLPFGLYPATNIAVPATVATSAITNPIVAH